MSVHIREDADLQTQNPKSMQNPKSRKFQADKKFRLKFFEIFFLDV